MPSTQQADGQPWASGPARTAATATHGMTATSTPVWQPGSAPEPGPVPAAAGNEFEDWDLLFRAVLETLARVAGEKATPNGTILQLQPPGNVLCECMDALHRLRSSVPLVQHHRALSPTPADGTIAT